MSTLQVLLLAVAIVISVAPSVHGQAAPIRFRSGATIDITIGDASGVQSFALADVNKDSRPDIVAIDQENDQVGVAINNGDGTFADPQFFSNGDFFTTPTAVAVADVGSRFSSATTGRPDGNVDILVADEDGTVTLLYGNGSGGFDFPDDAEELIETEATEAVGIALGNFDNQGGVNDFALLDPIGDVAFQCNNGDGVYGDCTTAVLEEDVGEGVAIGAGDFNGDGSTDVVALYSEDEESDGVVVVFLGNNSGTFTRSRLSVTVGIDARDLAVGRLNDDSIDDVAVVERTGTSLGDNLESLLGQSNGVLDNISQKGTLEVSSVALTLADFDGDSCLDAIGVSDDAASGTIPAISLGDCSGALSANPFGTVGVGAGRSIEAADLNGDSRVDFVSARQDGQSLRVALNQGNTTSTPGTPGANTDTPTPPATPTPTPERTVPLGPCDIPLPGDSQPVAMAAGDFDRDGVPDVAVVDAVSNQVHILLTDRESLRSTTNTCRTKGNIQSLPVIENPAAVAVGPINKDGRVDLAVAGPTGVTLLVASGGEGGFSVLRTIPTSSNPIQNLTSVGVDPRSVVIADFDQDGNSDLATANAGSDNVTVLYGKADITFEQRLRPTLPSATPTPGAENPSLAVADPSILVAADLDGDSWVDLAVASDIGATVTAFINTKQSTSFARLSNPRTIDAGHPTAMVPADIPRGGGSELLIAARSDAGNGSFLIATVTSTGAVTLSDPIATDPRPSAIGFGDFGAQGGPRGINDVVVASSIAHALDVFVGNPDGTFMPPLDPVELGLGSTPMAVLVADFDGDEIADIAVANAGDGTLTFLRSSQPPPTPVPTDTATTGPSNTPTASPSPGTPSATPLVTGSPTATIKEGTFVLGSCSVTSADHREQPGVIVLLLPALLLMWAKRRQKTQSK